MSTTTIDRPAWACQPSSTSVIYDLVNPSDPITFRAEPAIAPVVAYVLARSMLFVRNAEDQSDVRPLVDREFARRHDELYSTAETLRELAAVYDSFLIGSGLARVSFELAVVKMPPADAIEYRRQWNDRRRTSINDFCQQAWDAAAEMQRMAGDMR